MGNSASTSVIAGSIPGAVPDAVSTAEPARLPSRARELIVGASVPPSVQGITNGKQKLEIQVEGKPRSVFIPRGLKAGDKFRLSFRVDETEDVYASTLHSIPGMDILHAKAIVYRSVSVYWRHHHQGSQAAAAQVGKLIEQATLALRGEAVDRGCNAVLGITYNVTSDSSGDRGREKSVVVTAAGTPCVVVPSSSSPPVQRTGELGVAAPALPSTVPSAPPQSQLSLSGIPIVTAQAYAP